MSKNKNGGQAFPVAGSEHNYPIEGMTLLDYFAAKAMQSIPLALDDNEQQLIANASYRMADAMLRAREAS